MRLVEAIAARRSITTPHTFFLIPINKQGHIWTKHIKKKPRKNYRIRVLIPVFPYFKLHHRYISKRFIWLEVFNNYNILAARPGFARLQC
jgi:hypothetical protein